MHSVCMVHGQTVQTQIRRHKMFNQNLNEHELYHPPTRTAIDKSVAFHSA